MIVVTFPYTVVVNAGPERTGDVRCGEDSATINLIYNVALACLSATDAMVGILFQPPCLDIKVLALLLRLLELLSKIDSCPLQDVAKYSINFFLLSFADPSGVDYC